MKMTTSLHLQLQRLRVRKINETLQFQVLWPTTLTSPTSQEVQKKKLKKLKPLLRVNQSISIYRILSTND